MPAFLSIHRLPGDSEALLRDKRTFMDPVTARIAPDCGGIFSVTVKTSDGLLTINLWESREAAASLTRDPDVRHAREESGLPMPASFESYEDAEYVLYRAAGPFADERQEGDGVTETIVSNTAYIRTTADELWRALTNPEMTARYLGGARVQSRWQPGDEIAYLAPDRITRLIAGTLLEVEPNHRLVYTCRLLFDPVLAADRPHRETFVIEQMGPICKLTATFDQYAPDSPACRFAADGMPRTGSALKSLLETGEALAFSHAHA